MELARRNAFRTDPRLTAQESSHCADYAGTGYDRGHIVPRSDMNRSRGAQANTFFLSNMAPQTPAPGYRPTDRRDLTVRGTPLKDCSRLRICLKASGTPPIILVRADPVIE